MFTRLSIARTTAYKNLTTTVLAFAGAMVLHKLLMAGEIVRCVLVLVGIYGGQKYHAFKKTR